jgi:hypothetical protein
MVLSGSSWYQAGGHPDGTHDMTLLSGCCDPEIECNPLPSKEKDLIAVADEYKLVFI